MSDPVTPNYGWTLPDVGGDADAWGTLLNTNLTSIDSTVFGMMPKAGGTFTGAVVLAANGTALAPLKLTTGSLLTSPASGAFEYSASTLYFTDATPTRHTVAFLDSAITGSAAKLTTARTLGITGDLTWTSPSFDGSGNVTAAGTLATVNSNVGTFGSGSVVPVITVNAKGLVTAVTTSSIGTGVTSFNTRTGAVTLSSSDVTTALTYTPANKAGDTFSGGVTLPAGTTALVPLTIPQGSAPTTPANGNIWTTSSGVFARINSASQQLLASTNNLSELASATTARSNLGLGTSATVNTGTSGATVPLLNGANTWSGVQTYTNSDIAILGSSTGATTLTSANAGASNFTLTLPAATDTLVALAATQTLTNKSLTSPSLTGTPTAPTATSGTNTTQIASTAFVTAAIAAIPSATLSYAVFTNQQASGTNSGESIGHNAWVQRLINTTVVNTISGASLSSNQITLPGGTYAAYVSAACFSSTTGYVNSLIRLRNITGSATIANSPQDGRSQEGPNWRALMTVFVLSGSTTLEVDDWNNAGITVTGGNAISSGDPEVYVSVTLLKIA